MDSIQLYRFKVIAECGSVSKAAEALYVSQPTLSMMLKNLETELQCTLFYRKGHNFKITNDGIRLLKIANSVCDTIMSAEQEFKFQKSTGFYIYSCDYFYHALIPDFENSIPLNLFLNVIPNKDIPTKLFENRYSAAICDEYYMNPQKISDYVKRFLFQEHLYLYVCEGHKWQGRNSMSITEIGDEPLFCYSSNNGFSEWVTDVAALNQIQLNYAIALDKTMSAMYKDSIPYPRFFPSRVAWDIDSIPNKRSCFIKLTGSYTQRDICLWYHKQCYSNNRKIIDDICTRAVELNNSIICFNKGIDIPENDLKIKHYFS